MAREQIVTFQIGQEQYGVNILQVREIILQGSITSVPEVPHFVKGMINLRGQIIPIVDLQMLLKKTETIETDETRIMIVQSHKQFTGLIVDSVHEVVKIDTDEVKAPPESISSMGKDYVKGLISTNEALMILLHLDNIFDKAINSHFLMEKATA